MTDILQHDSLPTWSSLPLSLQHQIYSALLEQNSAQAAANALGLTQLEAREIEQARSERNEAPTSLNEMWDNCIRKSAQIPGLLQPQSFIDPDVLHESMKDMLFASRYEVAFEFEVRLAEAFLFSCSLPLELLGTWRRDPDDTSGTVSLMNASSMIRDQGPPSEEAGIVSDDSSAVEPDNAASDHTHDQPGPSPASTREAIVLGNSPAIRMGQPRRQSTLTTNKKKFPDSQCSPRRPALKSRKKNGRHPLANVTTPNQWESHRGSGLKKAPKEDGQPRYSGSSKGQGRSDNLVTSLAPEGLSGRIVLRFPRRYLSGAAPEESREASGENASPTPVHANIPTTSVSGTTTRVTLPLKKLNFGTRLNFFSKKLLMDEDSDFIMGGSEKKNTSKRRASQTDLRLSPPQIRRSSSRAGLRTPLKNGFTNSIIGDDRTHADEEDIQTPEPDERTQEAGDLYTPTKGQGVMPSIEFPSVSGSIDNGQFVPPTRPLRQGSYSPTTERPRSPRRPSCSPITEPQRSPIRPTYSFVLPTGLVRTPSWSPITEPPGSPVRPSHSSITDVPGSPIRPSYSPITNPGSPRRPSWSPITPENRVSQALPAPLQNTVAEKQTENHTKGSKATKKEHQTLAELLSAAAAKYAAMGNKFREKGGLLADNGSKPSGQETEGLGPASRTRARVKKSMNLAKDETPQATPTAAAKAAVKPRSQLKGRNVKRKGE